MGQVTIKKTGGSCSVRKLAGICQLNYSITRTTATVEATLAIIDSAEFRPHNNTEGINSVGSQRFILGTDGTLKTASSLSDVNVRLTITYIGSDYLK